MSKDYNLRNGSPMSICQTRGVKKFLIRRPEDQKQNETNPQAMQSFHSFEVIFGVNVLFFYTFVISKLNKANKMCFHNIHNIT